MRDGSDAIADWPVLSALLNAAQGASWVAIGNGGGVGVGRSIHSGMVVVADGSELAERKLRRVFWTDPALGVARYADAGYPEALAEASANLDWPALNGQPCPVPPTVLDTCTGGDPELSDRAVLAPRISAKSCGARRARGSQRLRSACGPAGPGTRAARSSTERIVESRTY